MEIKVINAKNKKHIGQVIDLGPEVETYTLNQSKAIRSNAISDFNGGQYRVTVQYPNQFSTTISASLSRYVNGEWAAQGGITLAHVEILNSLDVSLAWEGAHRDLQVAIKKNDWDSAIEACKKLKKYNF